MGLTTPGSYRWLQDPVSQRDYDTDVIDAHLAIHENDATLDYRFLTDELADVGIIASANRVATVLDRRGLRLAPPPQGQGPQANHRVADRTVSDAAVIDALLATRVTPEGSTVAGR